MRRRFSRRLSRSGGGALDLRHLILLTPRMICKRRTSYLTKCSQILMQSLLETLAFSSFLSFFLTTRKIYFLSLHPPIPPTPLSQCLKWVRRNQNQLEEAPLFKDLESFLTWFGSNPPRLIYGRDWPNDGSLQSAPIQSCPIPSHPSCSAFLVS